MYNDRKFIINTNWRYIITTNTTPTNTIADAIGISTIRGKPSWEIRLCENGFTSMYTIIETDNPNNKYKLEFIFDDNIKNCFGFVVSHLGGKFPFKKIRSTLVSYEIDGEFYDNAKIAKYSKSKLGKEWKVFAVYQANKLLLKLINHEILTINFEDENNQLKLEIPLKGYNEMLNKYLFQIQATKILRMTR